MIFFSVTDACSRLGIDAKTLRRWLLEAHLPLHDHPDDGRKKGVSSEHLHLLSTLHQRSLIPLPDEPQEQAPAVLSTLPACWLLLPETIGALQAQILALQQQVADLTAQLQVLPVSSGRSQAPSRLAKVSKPAPEPASRASSVASSPRKTPRKLTHVIPVVAYGKEGRYVVICPKQGVLSFEPDTPEWFTWVAQQTSFRFVGKEGYFSAHHEWRVPKGAWRAYRKIRNRNYIQRLAPSPNLTIAVLEQAATALQAHLT
jgi:hypothetical protein